MAKGATTSHGIIVGRAHAFIVQVYSFFLIIGSSIKQQTTYHRHFKLRGRGNVAKRRTTVRCVLYRFVTQHPFARKKGLAVQCHNEPPVGAGGPKRSNTQWPAWASYLTTSNSSLWYLRDYLKSQMYTALSQELGKLKDRIRVTLAEIFRCARRIV